MEAIGQFVFDPKRRKYANEAVSQADRAHVAAPAATRVENLECQQQGHPAQRQARAIDQGTAEDAGGREGFEHGIAGHPCQHREYQPQHGAHATVEGVVGHDFLLGQVEVQLLCPFGHQVIGTDPGAEGAPAKQEPQHHHRAGADQQVDDDVLVGQHHLQCGIDVDHVKTEQARGGERAFQDLDVEPERHHEQQVDANQEGPAPVAPGFPLLRGARGHVPCARPSPPSQRVSGHGWYQLPE